MAEPISAPISEPIPLQTQFAVYASGYLSTSMSNMAGMIIPLWVVLTMDPSAFTIGVIMGSRHFLPAILAIHGGAMMDHLGAKRVMLVFAIVGMIVPVLYPAIPWIGMIIILQMLAGLATTMSWMGAQTLIGQVMGGNPVHSGRLSSAALLGNLTVPLIIGAAWDHLGVWGAFMTMSLWGGGMVVAAILLPAPSKELSRGTDKINIRDFIPRLSGYLEAFALLSVPAIAVVVMVSVMRNTTYAVRSSFYVVYLDSIQFSGTEIGFLMSAAGSLGAISALLVGPVTKVIKPVILLFITVTCAIIFISLTPLMATFWQLMVIAMLWGASVGMSMPLMFSIMARAADSKSQGKSVGIRLTANRLAASGLPVLMGGIAEITGIGNSFLVIGVVMLASLGGVALYAQRVIGPPKE
ncbi:MAG: MFS transporter [Rhodospirillales bacterium]|nr:MFS transporter [Rhodospirillales bacterium]MBT5075159.1 MFS transporter [Rhodospirillales bacterium]MBT5114089.1 MFS transporter [Rhodospirillales bacterium]MBT5672617.1 MFS transporter [Rhodospirillales bacterium]MBT6185713.1 MFS transporter [Rhodospirillales bacterium]